MTFTEEPPSRPDLACEPVARNGLAQASQVSGIGALIAFLVPPGLLVAPLFAVAAIALGIAARTSPRRLLDGADQAVTGIVLGAVTLAASATTLWLFRHLIARILNDINLV